MVISMEEEQKIFVYQDTMNLDVESIAKNKKLDTNTRSYWYLVFCSIETFSAKILDKYKNYPNGP